jgi:hypothetical protein
MVRFAEWLSFEERTLVATAVLASYERTFQQGLEALIQRTPHLQLRQAFEQMRQFRFTSYILGALVRHGIHQQYDVEDCLQRIVFRMLSPVGEQGLPRSTLFDFDPNRPYNLQIGNPLEARFRTFLVRELKNITMGRIPALRRPQRPGSLSIAYGTQEAGFVSPDTIPGRLWNRDEELFNDIVKPLRQRSMPDMPLVDRFQSALAGEGTRVQRARFGHSKADAGRKIIMQIIGQYA